MSGDAPTRSLQDEADVHAETRKHVNQAVRAEEIDPASQQVAHAWLCHAENFGGFCLSQSARAKLLLLEHLRIERAHVVGHSSGGNIALQLALDAPEVVHSLVLLEPGLLNVPSGALLAEAFGPALQRYDAGDKEGAADNFVRWAIGPDYRAWLDRLIPGA
jgi:pimeloyl-ACP methyl ester carboxylesterase